VPDEEVIAAEQSAWQRAKADTRRVVGTLWFVIGVPLLDIAAAAIALIVASETHSSGALYVVAAIGAAGIGTIAAFVGVWTFQVIRAPVRQRNETRAKVTELTAVAPFPNVLIEIRNFRQDFQDHAGKRISDGHTHRVWFPVVVTNREESRRVSLRFDVSINSPDGSSVLFPRLPTEQEDRLPLVVDPQDSKSIQLSVFLNEYVTERLRTEQMVGRFVSYDVNGDLFRLNVFDLLSQKGIEMRLPGFHPQESAPDSSS
jgi:hypothetical protein